MHWRRKWQPIPVFLPGESQGRGSLVGCHLWGRTESDTIEARLTCFQLLFKCRLKSNILVLSAKISTSHHICGKETNSFKIIELENVFFMIITREGSGTPLQYSCLLNPMDGGAWWAAVHGVAKSRTRLSDFTFTFHFHALEEEMATHSSVLAWRITGTGGLPSLWSHRVGHD